MNEELNRISQSPPRPEVFSSLGWGWKSMKANFLVFFLTVIVLGIIQAPNSWQDNDFPDGNVRPRTETSQPAAPAGEVGDVEDVEAVEDVGNRPFYGGRPIFVNAPYAPFFGLLIMAYLILLVPVFKYSADLVFLRGTRGEKVEMKTLIAGFSKYLNVVLASLLTFSLCIIGLIFFIIPGIIVACRLAFVPYLVMDEDMDPIEAVEGSWRLTRGHAWQIFGLYLLAIPLCIIGLLLLVIGIFPALMWISATFAAFYLSVSASKKVTPVEEAVTTPAGSEQQDSNLDA